MDSSASNTTDAETTANSKESPAPEAPANIYKIKRPDFRHLASKYEQFAKYCTIEPNGRLRFDFKDADAVRALSWCLLKDDFNLDVEMPPDCLVPRVPVRLNYILWVHQLLSETGLLHDHINGIDIGTGATCVYALLGVKHCGWKFLATEKESSLFECAKKNVERNNMKNDITVVQVPDESALYDVLSNNEFVNRTFDFCMSNPPFYDKKELQFGDADKDAPTSSAESSNVTTQDNAADKETTESKQRQSAGATSSDSTTSTTTTTTTTKSTTTTTAKSTTTTTTTNSVLLLSEAKPTSRLRQSPHSVTVARTNEVCAEGGELAFVKRIIADTKRLDGRVKIGTSMLGKKSSLGPLSHFLKEQGAMNVTQTKFMQGRTMRWGLAWTFDPNVKFDRSKDSTDDKKRKKPLYIPLDLGGYVDLQSAQMFVKKILDHLQISCVWREGDANSNTTDKPKWPEAECTAMSNTWTHQRQKRRQQKKNTGANGATGDVSQQNEGEPVAKQPKIDVDAEAASTTTMLPPHDLFSNQQNETSASITNPKDTNNDPTVPSSVPIPLYLVKFLATVRPRHPPDGQFDLRLSWLGGKDKDALNQIGQYLKNVVVKHSDMTSHSGEQVKFGGVYNPYMDV